MKYYTSMEQMAKKYDEMIKEYEWNEQALKDFDGFKKKAQHRLAEISGLDQCFESSQDDLKPHMHEQKQLKEYTKQYWTIETQEDIIMPFYLLIPAKDKCTGAAVIIPHGHFPGGKEGMVPNYEFLESEDSDCFAIQLVKAGYCVACPDERGAGERLEYPQQGGDNQSINGDSHREILHMALGFGQTVIGLAVWDLMRLIDFLSLQPYIDKERIGCAGMSGGGQQTLWLAALDSRIKAAVTSGYFYGMKESLILLPHNCSCNYVPNLWKTMDMGDMGGLVAPNALLIESGEQDHLNGKNGLLNVYSQVEKAKMAYKHLGVSDKIKHSIHEGGHVWNGKDVLPFLDKWLNYM